MKILWLIPFFLFRFSTLYAQLGISVTTDMNATPEWQVLIENYVAHRHFDFLKHGTSATLDYRINLPSKRWKLRPAVYAMRSSLSYFPHQFAVNAFGLQFNVSFHSLNGKLRDGVQRRFYMELSPGLAWFIKKYDYPIYENEPFSGNYIHYNHDNLVANLGFLIAREYQLSPLLSIAPTAGVRVFPNLNWADFSENVSEGEIIKTFDRTNWKQFSLGLRIGINPLPAKGMKTE